MINKIVKWINVYFEVIIVSAFTISMVIYIIKWIF